MNDNAASKSVCYEGSNAYATGLAYPGICIAVLQDKNRDSGLAG
jgi:hypothetical protein